MTRAAMPTSLARPLLAVAALAGCLAACSGVDLGPAPVISDLTIPSPLPADTTRLEGTVHVTDPLGLTALTILIVVTTATGTQSLPPITVTSTVVGQTEATVGFHLDQKKWITSGTQQFNVTVLEVDTPSNTLSANVVIE